MVAQFGERLAPSGSLRYYSTVGKYGMSGSLGSTAVFNEEDMGSSDVSSSVYDMVKSFVQ